MANGVEAEQTHCLGHISARGVALAGRQGDAGHEIEGEGRRKSAHEHCVRQQRVGRGVPGHQQVEGEAAQLVDGVVCAQARVRLQANSLSVPLQREYDRPGKGRIWSAKAVPVTAGQKLCMPDLSILLSSCASRRRDSVHLQRLKHQRTNQCSALDTVRVGIVTTWQKGREDCTREAKVSSSVASSLPLVLWSAHEKMERLGR